MERIAREDVRARLARDNPWWNAGREASFEAGLPKRVYFETFKTLALNFNIKRAAILLGPRRVGKTVMIKQVVEAAIANGLAPRDILYASIDTPLYSGLALESFVNELEGATTGRQCLIAFDEIQYLRDWQIHLKDLVDSYPNVKFIASGSAAAALSLQSKESGAGRFSDFMLPPLTFSEYVDFSDKTELVQMVSGGNARCTDIESLNKLFVEYLNFGGYPEVVFNNDIRSNPDQFIRNDIIDKVLLKDLPSLYGIDNIQELNRLFMFLAYNSGNEASYENISQESELPKAKIKRYIEYLQSAFLIIKISTTNDNCKNMQRERQFKVYLNNPSMRAALFSPVDEKDTTLIGHLAESAVFSQWQHSSWSNNLRYARWRNEGEVDVVYLASGTQKPRWIGEVKWSDRFRRERKKTLKNIIHLLDKHSSIEDSFLTTRTIRADEFHDGRRIQIWPTALYCYMVGKNTTSRDLLSARFSSDVPEEDEPEFELGNG